MMLFQNDACKKDASKNNANQNDTSKNYAKENDTSKKMSLSEKMLSNKMTLAK